MSQYNHTLMLFYKEHDSPKLTNTLYSYSSLKIQDGRHVYCLKYRIRIFRNTMNLLQLPGVKGFLRIMNLIMNYSKLKIHKKLPKKMHMSSRWLLKIKTVLLFLYIFFLSKIQILYRIIYIIQLSENLNELFPYKNINPRWLPCIMLKV